MLRFSFARFSSFAFVVRCFVTLRVVAFSPFCFAFLFVLVVFAFISFYWPFGLFLFGSFFFVFFGSCLVLLRLCTPGFLVSFVSFAIVSFAFAFSARFVQSLAFFIYFSWRSV